MHIRYILQPIVSSFLYYYLMDYLYVKENPLLRWPDEEQWSAICSFIITEEKVNAIRTLRLATEIPAEFPAPYPGTKFAAAYASHKIGARNILGLKESKDIIDWMWDNQNTFYEETKI